jgi:hypothetical protein
MPGQDSTATQAVDILTAYLTSPAAFAPDPADPRYKLDGVVYWRMKQSAEAGALYEAFRVRPLDPGLRKLVVRLIAETMAADGAFADALARVGAFVMPLEATQPAYPPGPWQQGFGGYSYPFVQVQRRRRGRAWAAIGAAAVLLLGAGTGIGVALSGGSSAPSHYTFADDPSTSPSKTFDIFDWTTDTAGILTGTYRGIDPADPTNPAESPIVGHQEGDTVTFKPGTDFASSNPTFTAKIKGATLTITAPLNSAGPATATFHKTTIADFDKAVQQYVAQHPLAPTA